MRDHKKDALGVEEGRKERVGDATSHLTPSSVNRDTSHLEKEEGIKSRP